MTDIRNVAITDLLGDTVLDLHLAIAAGRRVFGDLLDRLGAEVPR